WNVATHRDWRDPHRAGSEVVAVEGVIAAVLLSSPDELPSFGVGEERGRGAPVAVPILTGVVGQLPAVFDFECLEVETDDGEGVAVFPRVRGAGGDEDVATLRIDRRRRPHTAPHLILGDKIAGLQLDSRGGIEADDGAARKRVVAVAGDALDHLAASHGGRAPAVVVAGSGVVAERFPPDDAERVLVERVKGV